MALINELNKKFDFVIGFKLREEIEKKELDEQDRKHLRILGIAKINERQCLPVLINNRFTERFFYDQKEKVGFYCVKIIQRKEVRKYADS